MSDATQVYWRIKNAAGKYFDGYNWVRDVYGARAYPAYPLETMREWVSDPTARVVRVTVRRKVRESERCIYCMHVHHGRDMCGESVVRGPGRPGMFGTSVSTCSCRTKPRAKRGRK